MGIDVEKDVPAWVLIAEIERRLQEARAEAALWKQRYEAQHGTAFRLEDELAKKRNLRDS